MIELLKVISMYDVPKKMSKGKKIELVVLICAIAWGVIFIVNYFRYSNSKINKEDLKVY